MNNRRQAGWAWRQKISCLFIYRVRQKVASYNNNNNNNNNNKCIGDDTKAAARKSPNCIKKPKKYGEKRFSIWRMELLHPSMWHDHDIDFARWLDPAMWHVALESWQWIHQVAAPWSVMRGSGMTCHGIRPNVRHIGILHLVSILTISPQSTCHYALVCEILSKSNHPQQKKMTSCQCHVDFQDGGCQSCWILGVK